MSRCHDHGSLGRGSVLDAVVHDYSRHTISTVISVDESGNLHYREPTVFDYEENFPDRNRDFWGRELWLAAWMVGVTTAPVYFGFDLVREES